MYLYAYERVCEIVELGFPYPRFGAQTWRRAAAQGRAGRSVLLKSGAQTEGPPGQ